MGLVYVDSQGWSSLRRPEAVVPLDTVLIETILLRLQEQFWVPLRDSERATLAGSRKASQSVPLLIPSRWVGGTINSSNTGSTHRA